MALGVSGVLMAASAGSAWPMPLWLLAQDQGTGATGSPPPASGPGTPETDDLRRKREEMARKLEELRKVREDEAARQRQQNQQVGGAPAVPPQPGVPQPGVVVAQPAPGPNGMGNGDQGNGDQGAGQNGNVARGELIAPGDAELPEVHIDPNTPLSLDFTDPVDLMEFVGWVSKTLKINILSDEGLTGRRVVFRAPVKIMPADLLRLLGRLIEDQDFVFSKDPLGFYTIKPTSKVPIVIGGLDGELATTRVIPTPMIRPSTMQQAVNSAMGGAGGQPSGIRITPVDDIGVLIVTGSPGTLDTVDLLVKTISDELAMQKLHRFPLLHVAADFALNRVLTLNGKVSPQFGQGQQIPQGVPSAGGVSGALTHLDSRLFIDPGNAIIFRGTDDEARLVEELIRLVDVVNSLIARRYVSGSVTAEVAKAGEKMGLGPASETSSTSGFGSFNSGFTGNRQNFGQAGQFGQGSGSEASGSGFTVDVERGSIIYYGTEAQHEVVAQLVKDFTELALSEDVEIRAYKLLYAKAKETAEVLNDLLRNPRDRTSNSSFLPRSGNRGTSSPLVTPREEAAPAAPAVGGEDSTTLTATDQDTVIVADEGRNQILIKASGRQQREFARILKKLDERQPQVYIEAKIVAVRLDNTFTYRSDLQIDADAFQFLSSFGLTAPATNAIFNDRRNVVNPGTGVSGVTAALLNQDRVLGVIQALQVVGDARIVSTPRILVNDNEEATQKSVREEPFAATSQTSGNPTITSQGGTATAGTSLTVTPTISQNGDIVLEYAIELSNFDRSATTNPNLQPPKQTENYESKVTVPSDSTIVVGGFTFESKQSTENKVPFLGDIPVVGLLFKSIGEVTNRTTIFVFITPRVLSDPTGADLRILSEGPAREMKIELVTPDLMPEVVSISPRSLSLPALQPGADAGSPVIDSKPTTRRVPPGASPETDPAVSPAPAPAPEVMPGAAASPELEAAPASQEPAGGANGDA